MRLSLFVLWAVVGWWCPLGVPVWRWWRRRIPIPPIPTDPFPEPPPEPWLILRGIGVVGGIIGGMVFTAAFGFPVPWLTAGPQPEPWLTAGPHPEPWMGVIFAAATTVGAFLGASLLTDIYGLIRGNRDVPRG